MQQSNQPRKEITESKFFYLLSLVILVFVLAEFVSNGLAYLDNH
jgi:hypothetical protein